MTISPYILSPSSIFTTSVSPSKLSSIVGVPYSSASLNLKLAVAFHAADCGTTKDMMCSLYTLLDILKPNEPVDVESSLCEMINEKLSKDPAISPAASF